VSAGYGEAMDSQISIQQRVTARLKVAFIFRLTQKVKQV
jgi:hypothetical protein